ncbi:MAG: DUF21 domain-containing protein [bacterium]
MKTIIWIAIIISLSQSAILSGLNLAFFKVSKLKLELETIKKNEKAKKVLKLRENSNFLLVTILWGNVSINVILALLSDSVLGGIAAFLFSTVFITIIGEIVPQAYFSRNAINMASKLTPILRFYQIILYPVAKPTAFVLDRWLGEEAINFYKEADFKELVKFHMSDSKTEIEKLEGTGIINFLDLDDLKILEEGEIVEPRSIIELEFKNGKPVFPKINRSNNDKFINDIYQSQKKWVILTDKNQENILTLNSDKFITDALLNKKDFNPIDYCHKPVIVKDDNYSLNDIIPKLKLESEHKEDDVIDKDVILLWNDTKKIITGSDILGRLLRGIVKI